jgi:deoxyxylulose-5-phosphate synthase
MLAARGIRAGVRMYGVGDRIVPHGARCDVTQACGMTPEAFAADLEEWIRNDGRQTT